MALSKTTLSLLVCLALALLLLGPTAWAAAGRPTNRQQHRSARRSGSSSSNTAAAATGGAYTRAKLHQHQDPVDMEPLYPQKLRERQKVPLEAAAIRSTSSSTSSSSSSARQVKQQRQQQQLREEQLEKLQEQQKQKQQQQQQELQHHDSSAECKICHGITHVSWVMLKTYNSSMNIITHLAKEGCGLMREPGHEERCVKCVEKFRKVNRDVVNSMACHLRGLCEETGFCDDDDDDDDRFEVFERARRGEHPVDRQIRMVAQCGRQDQETCPAGAAVGLDGGGGGGDWRQLDRDFLHRDKHAMHQHVLFEERIRITRV